MEERKTMPLYYNEKVTVLWALQAAQAMQGLPESFRRALQAGNKAKGTVRSYMDSIRLFYEYLAREEKPLDIRLIQKRDVEGWIIELQTAPNSRTGKPVAASTLGNRYKALHIYFAWALDEGEIKKDPMEKMRRPILPETQVAVLTDDEIARLLRVCYGMDFYSRRDTAIIRLFLDTGLRVSELVGLKLDDINWQQNNVLVMGKGRKPRTVPFGRKTAQALDRYIRARASYPSAYLPNLWLGHAGGPLTASGVLIMLRKRGERAGIDHCHPHLFRHELAHTWLSEGGTEGGLMRIMGWNSRNMLTRYAASAATKRAHEEHGRLQPGDKF